MSSQEGDSPLFLREGSPGEVIRKALFKQVKIVEKSECVKTARVLENTE